MNNRRIKIAITCILIVGLVVVFTVVAFRKAKLSRTVSSTTTSYQITTPSNVKDGRVVLLTELLPPYVIQNLGIQESFDQTDVMQVVEALMRIPRTNREPYLALMDDGVRQQYKEIHAGDSNQNADAVPTKDEFNSVISHWVDVLKDDKAFRIVVALEQVADGEPNQFYLVFKSSNGKWLQTFDLDNTDIKFFIGVTPLAELKSLIKP